MQVLVTLKWIPDPELPPSLLRFTSDGRRAGPDVPRSVGPFDKAALEAALRLRDACPSTSIACASVGPAQAEDALRLALGHGVDHVFRVEAPDLGPDAVTAAFLLKEALLRRPRLPDAVLVGEVSGDWDQGVFGPALAEHLGWPFLERIAGLAPEGPGVLSLHQLMVERERTLRLPTPFVASVTSHPDTALRFPSLKDVLASKRRQVEAEGTPGAAETIEVLSLTLPDPPQTACRFVEGAECEQAEAVRQALKEWGVLAE